MIEDNCFDCCFTFY